MKLLYQFKNDLFIYLFLPYDFEYLPVYVCTMGMQCLGKQVEGIGSPGSGIIIG